MESSEMIINSSSPFTTTKMTIVNMTIASTNGSRIIGCDQGEEMNEKGSFLSLSLSPVTLIINLVTLIVSLWFLRIVKRALAVQVMAQHLLLTSGIFSIIFCVLNIANAIYYITAGLSPADSKNCSPKSIEQWKCLLTTIPVINAYRIFNLCMIALGIERLYIAHKIAGEIRQLPINPNASNAREALGDSSNASCPCPIPNPLQNVSYAVMAKILIALICLTSMGISGIRIYVTYVQPTLLVSNCYVEDFPLITRLITSTVVILGNFASVMALVYANRICDRQLQHFSRSQFNISLGLRVRLRYTTTSTKMLMSPMTVNTALQIAANLITTLLYNQIRAQSHSLSLSLLHHYQLILCPALITFLVYCGIKLGGMEDQVTPVNNRIGAAGNFGGEGATITRNTRTTHIRDQTTTALPPPTPNPALRSHPTFNTDLESNVAVLPPIQPPSASSGLPQLSQSSHTLSRRPSVKPKVPTINEESSNSSPVESITISKPSTSATYNVRPSKSSSNNDSRHRGKSLPNTSTVMVHPIPQSRATRIPSLPPINLPPLVSQSKSSSFPRPHHHHHFHNHHIPTLSSSSSTSSGSHHRFKSHSLAKMYSYADEEDETQQATPKKKKDETFATNVGLD